MLDNIQISLLFDFYGPLLNEAQQEVVELCINNDLSLSEAAEELNISRQGVRDSLKRATDKLEEFEAKLGLMKAYEKSIKDLAEFKVVIANLNVADEKSEEMKTRIQDAIQTILDKGDYHGV